MFFPGNILVLKRHKILISLIKIMPHWKYQIFQCDDYLIYGNLLDTTVRQSFIRNSYEEDILFQRIAFFLTGDTVCLDIGANYGFHTMGVLSLSAKYKPIMHMIEPNKDCVHCLKKTIEKNSLDNVFIHDLALDKEEGEAIFQCDNLQTVTGSLGNFSIAQYKKKQRAEKWDHYSVQKVSLDRWMEDNSIASVRVMKLDTSGYDWNIY
jgi:FkbM family methyltransferase